MFTIFSDYDENGPSYDELYDLTMERYQDEWYASPDQMNNDHWKFMTGIFSCIPYAAYDYIDVGDNVMFVTL